MRHISPIYTAPSLVVKVQYPDSNAEITVGYAISLQYTSSQGQRAIYTVDNPFPVELAQSAAASLVRGVMVMYMPRGATPEKLGLVPYRINNKGENAIAATKYIHLRLYDRLTQRPVVNLEFCKINGYTTVIAARQVVRVELTFEALYAK